MTDTSPLWRCRACGFKTRDVAAARVHENAARPSYFFGPHQMYAPPTLDHAGVPSTDFRVVVDAARTTEAMGGSDE